MHGLDLSPLSRDQLLVLEHDVKQALAAAEQRARKDAMERLRETAREAGFSLDDLIGNGAKPADGAKPKRERSASSTVYTNPKDANQTWNGRGRPPAWFNAALAEGTTRDAMKTA